MKIIAGTVGEKLVPAVSSGGANGRCGPVVEGLTSFTLADSFPHCTGDPV